MTLSLTGLDFLTSDAGEALLKRLANENLSESHTLTLITRLRRDYSPTQAAAALELARLRAKAASKFGENAARLYFTRDALEQASDPLIRAYRARLEPYPQTVTDACCGIGADALAFAAQGAQVVGLDLDPVRIAIAQLNASVLGVDHLVRFEVRDVREGLPSADLVFFDPARRDEAGDRIFDVEQYLPPLSVIHGWDAPRLMVKLSPGVDLAQVQAYNGEVEFISVQGELKEAVLHIEKQNTNRQDAEDAEKTQRGFYQPHPNPSPSNGEGQRGGDTTHHSSLATDDSSRIPHPAALATLITPDGTPHHWRRTHDPEPRPLSAPHGWLIEPDPALIRAGLVQDAAIHFDGFQLDETIAYFTTDHQPDSVWLRAWRIHDWMPFNLKHLRAYLRERNVGRVTVKKRGSPITPEQLIAQLKLKTGTESRTLVLTRHADQPIVIICDEMPINST